MALAPQPAFAAVRDRLRLRIVDEDFFDDDRLLGILNRGYGEACERSLCLRSIASVSFTGTYASLPERHYKTLMLYQGGAALDRLPGRNALLGTIPGYFEAGTQIGITPLFVTDPAVAFLLYARTPEDLQTFTQDLEPGFPQEFHYLLWHYARWRWFTEAGGAGHITQARWERMKFDEGVRRLRRYSRRVDFSRRSRFVHVLESGARRHRALAPDVDAR